MEDGDRTFKSNFSDEGLLKLKERINEKLKEFMGDYTDDTLVEYVIVLLRNGRRKDDTAKELHVFLGDDNIPFISWLWDHLSSDLHLYLEPEQVTNLQKDPQDKDQSAKRLKAESEISTEKTGRKRQKIVWEKREERGEERERRKFPLKSVVSSVLSSVHERESSNSYNNNNNNNNNNNRMRYQQNDTQQVKRAAPQLVAPPRRLLQSAVRDAITPRSGSRIGSEPVNNKPVLRRLRSVLSSDSAHQQQHQENQEHQEDQEYQEHQEDQEEREERELEREEEVTYDRGTRGGVRGTGGGGRMEGSSLLKREGSSSSSVFDRLGRAGGETGILKEEEDVSDNEGYDDHAVQYSVKQEKGAEKKSVQASQIANKPSKILNISVNVNTWKPAGTNVETNQSHQFSVQNTDQTNKVLVLGNVQSTPKAVTTPVAGGFKATQSLDDPETRTLFVSNVHFGATKDALSRHFNKFGAVLKVIILLDTTTGQPTGSAFVEFLRKESAEAALSLNGTSFMSRILKVVRRDSSDASQLPGWPSRQVRRSSTPGPITARARGGMARSLQWTRGTSTSTSTNQAVQPVQLPGSNVQARSFTYTRVPQKTE